VTSRNGKTWYAATCDTRYALNPDVFVMPGGKRLFIRGVAVDAENLLRWEKVPLFDVEECMISPDGKIAVMHDHCAAAGYSRSGLHWLVRLDYLNGIKFTRIDNRQVFLTATVDPDIVAECPIALALWSGGDQAGACGSDHGSARCRAHDLQLLNLSVSIASAFSQYST
jgi:hypothetical protein